MDKYSVSQCDGPVEIEITPQMIAAGMDAFSIWKREEVYINECEAIKEIFLALLAQSKQLKTMLVQEKDQKYHEQCS